MARRVPLRFLPSRRLMIISVVLCALVSVGHAVHDADCSLTISAKALYMGGSRITSDTQTCHNGVQGDGCPYDDPEVCEGCGFGDFYDQYEKSDYESGICHDLVLDYCARSNGYARGCDEVMLEDCPYGGDLGIGIHLRSPCSSSSPCQSEDPNIDECTENIITYCEQAAAANLSSQVGCDNGCPYDNDEACELCGYGHPDMFDMGGCTNHVIAVCTNWYTDHSSVRPLGCEELSVECPYSAMENLASPCDHCKDVSIEDCAQYIVDFCAAANASGLEVDTGCASTMPTPTSSPTPSPFCLPECVNKGNDAVCQLECLFEECGNGDEWFDCIDFLNEDFSGLNEDGCMLLFSAGLVEMYNLEDDVIADIGCSSFLPSPTATPSPTESCPFDAYHVCEVCGYNTDATGNVDQEACVEETLNHCIASAFEDAGCELLFSACPFKTDLEVAAVSPCDANSPCQGQNATNSECSDAVTAFCAEVTEAGLLDGSGCPQPEP